LAALGYAQLAQPIRLSVPLQLMKAVASGRIPLEVLLSSDGWDALSETEKRSCVSYLFGVARLDAKKFAEQATRLGKTRLGVIAMTTAEILTRKGRREGLQQGLRRGLRQGLERGLEQGLERGLEQGLERGLEQGLERGLERGVEQGRMEALRDSVVVALKSRFGELPMALIRKIHNVDQARRLVSLHKSAVTLPSLPAFASLLKRSVKVYGSNKRLLS
jgi:hypothetical protein